MAKNNKFMLLLREISTNLKEATAYFSDNKLRTTDDIVVFSNQMKEFETKGDQFVHTIIKDLNHVFITPIEREDILSFAMSMDDVLDGLEKIASLFEIYSITNADYYMLQFVEYIKNCTLEIDQSVELLASKKLVKMREHAIKIKDYESKCDDVLRESIKHLFQVEKDPIRIIQYKEIYEEFEEIADYCQNVANTIEAIIMKNA
jgi:uncharacterized protein